MTPSPATALFINDEVEYYMVATYCQTIDDGSAAARTVKGNMTEQRWYKIDRERMRVTDASNQVYGGVYYTELRTDAVTNVEAIRCKGLQWENPTNPFIRFYWLNKLGGIDAYTVKGQQSISYTNSKQTILRPRLNPVTGSKTPYNANSNGFPYPHTAAGATPLDINPIGNFLTDSLGGMDTYNGGREVLNVESNKIGVATTLPLNERKALWLRELAASPNVWIEYQNMVSWYEANSYYYRMYYRSVNDISPTSTGGFFSAGRHPNNLDYLPVIITNDSVDVYDDAQGLVTMTFEYTYAHPINTQRN